MAKEQNLAHTKCLCRYHIVFTSKYRRKVIYGQYREETGKIIRQLCNYKIIEIIERHMMIDHVHMLVMIPLKYAISSVMGYIKGKSSLMIFDKFSQLKYRYGNWIFWSVGYYVSTAGLNEATIRKYIREQDREYIMLDKRTSREYTDPFSSKQGKLL
ncbi:IS200/IS605 family transposase [Mailhella massiliensis]|uniref:IS200/IS605 family transposase n=1 Tax=Mailhella massiliensis TaxID=1903261 RepID=UPI00097D2CC5|nr:IS200/IS605 family transposase [Mailhella massiliensis]